MFVSMRPLVCALVFIAACTRASAQPAPPTDKSDADVTQLAERALKSMVVISSATRDNQRDALGSGFIISPDGLIVTNFHVIGEGRAVRVRLHDGRSFEPTIIHASDRANDLAVIKIDAANLPALELGRPDELVQGQRVVALGNPLGLRNSVAAGVVSGLREMDGRRLVQLAMPIEQGNSGGPVLDMSGKVQGVISMKSLVTPNLGFAVAIDSLAPLLASPNPIPMNRWLTIGALDPHEWQPLWGARWRQRAGRIVADGEGEGFGGRTLCVSCCPIPQAPCEIAVAVQLDDESGAAGLAFCVDDQRRHYGFYATAGRLRLTRFEGPDVNSWTILFDQPSHHYATGKWNTLLVRIEPETVVCLVNDQPVTEVKDAALRGGQAGLVKFRETSAQFRNFRVGQQLAPVTPSLEDFERITRMVERMQPRGPLDASLVEKIAAEPDQSGDVLRMQAERLDAQAAQLRRLAAAAHQRRVVDALSQELARAEKEIDLIRAGLLVARLDNEEVDIEHYLRLFERMVKELAELVPADATERGKLEALNQFMFAELGFHGSRGDYHNRANSYLNEVLDDREGLPITLCVIYMELARHIGLDVCGLPLPGHFIVRHTATDGDETLLDVFECATPVSRDDANARVRENLNRDISEAEWQSASMRAIVTRMLHNLLGLSGDDPHAMQRYLNAILTIDESSVQHRWMRAIVAYRLEDSDLALADIDWLQAHHSPGVEPQRVQELKRAVETQAGDRR